MLPESGSSSQQVEVILVLGMKVMAVRYDPERYGVVRAALKTE